MYQFTAHEFDSGTGLYYYRARYYDQSTGRLPSEDPIRFDGGLNFYPHAVNDPVDNTDPLGLEPETGCKDCNGKSLRKSENQGTETERFNGFYQRLLARIKWRSVGNLGSDME